MNGEGSKFDTDSQPVGGKIHPVAVAVSMSGDPSPQGSLAVAIGLRARTCRKEPSPAGPQEDEHECTNKDSEKLMRKL
jgi:hypothetical protein